jgi:hypothetical protein
MGCQAKILARRQFFYGYIGGMEKKRGRPRMPKANRRTAGIKLPLSGAEKRVLENAATARGAAMAVWIRMVALEAAAKTQNNVGRE